MSDKIKILAIESSCDETAAAVVEDGRCVKSNIISSQIELHKLYGGVVPEIASRKHVEKVNFVVREALNSADSAFLLALSYSAGYACGVMVGMYLSDKYVVSNVSVNIVVKQKREVVDALINHNFAVSVSRVKGKDLISNKYMIFVATTNKKLPLLKKLVTEIDSHAFIVVSENKYVVGGY